MVAFKPNLAADEGFLGINFASRNTNGCLPINDFSRKMIDASVAELIDERDAVRSLGLIY